MRRQIGSPFELKSVHRPSSRSSSVAVYIKCRDNDRGSSAILYLSSASHPSAANQVQFKYQSLCSGKIFQPFRRTQWGHLVRRLAAAWACALASDLQLEECQVSKVSYMTDKDKIAVFLMGVAIGILTGVFVTQMKGVPVEGIADSVSANALR